MSSKHDIKRNACQLFGRQAKCGYDWWWHSFTAQNAETGERRHTRLWNGGNGEGTICLYKKGKLIDRIHAENVGCEYGEFDATEPYRE